MLRRLAVMVVVLASAAADAQNRGVPQSGFPNWQERMIYVYTNRSRADPVTELAGCAGCLEKACYPSPLKPVIWSYNLNRSARFHSGNLEGTGCFQHPSPCALVSGISNVYLPTGTCNGDPACACTGGTFTCGSTGTDTFVRIAAFGTSGNGENIAYYSNGTPRQIYDLWIFETSTTAACGFTSANGHRYNILNGSLNSLGAGYFRKTRDMYTQDFAGSGAQSGTLITGGHDPQYTTSGTTTVNFRVNYYHTAGGPQSAQLNIDGTCSAMAQERGVTPTNATWLASLPLTGTTCRRYVFEFKDPAGATVLLPETGSYGVGNAACADWTAAGPSSCPVSGNNPPTVATAAAATPNPTTTTTTALSVLGADDQGEPALTYTWSSSGPAAVTFSANGTNAARASTATFTQVGTYVLTVTLRDAGNLTASSTVSVTVTPTLTTVTVTPGTASIGALGTQQFTASGKDQFGTPLAVQPTFTWTTSGGGTVSATGLYTAGATPGGPYSVTATLGSVSNSGMVTVTAGSPPTVGAAAAANPNPVTASTTALTVSGLDDGGEPALTYTWSATGPAAVTFSANGTNAAKASTATFSAAGTYVITATIRDAGNLSVTSTVNVTVNQTLTTVVVTPAASNVVVNGTRSFTAQGSDQFGAALSPQPTWTWLVSGGGTISSAGLFTAGASLGGPFTVTASSGGKSGTAQVTVTAGNAPTVATPAAATPSTVTGTTAALAVLGADDGGEAGLSYAWTATGPAAVTFSANGTNGAKASTATFTRAGSYTITVTLTDAGGQTITSTVVVVVQQTLTTVQVTPAIAAVGLSGTLSFTASARDQFANALVTQPAFAWTVSGGGTIGGSSGVFTAGATAGGPYTVTATAGSVSGTASVTVASGTGPTVATAAAAAPNPVVSTTTGLSVLGADDGGEAALTYTWSATGPAPVTFSANASNGAKAAVATFTAAGSYTFTVVVKDAGGLTTTSTVTVTVQQTPTAIAVLPATVATQVGDLTSFSASVADQFGAALAPQPAITWSAAGGGTISAAGVFTATTAGGPFTVTATAGSLTGSAAVTVASGPDVTAPGVAILTPADGATVSGLVALTANAADDRGVARVEYFADGVSVGSAQAAPWPVSWISGSAAVGPHTLTARATDTSGNTTDSAPITVTVSTVPTTTDNTAPLVQISSPANGTVVNGRFTVVAAATDDVAVTRVVFLVDGNPVGSVTSGAYRLVLDAAALSVGAHQLTAHALDAAGNVGESTAVAVVRERQTDVVGGLSCGCSSGGAAGVWLGAAMLLMLGRRRSGKR